MRVKTSYSARSIVLITVSVHYRRDARELWDNFAFSLSCYLSSLGFVAVIQGTLTAISLFLLGVP